MTSAATTAANRARISDQRIERPSMPSSRPRRLHSSPITSITALIDSARARPLDAHRPDQQDHERDVDRDRDDRPGDGRPRVLHRVERAGQDVDDDVADQPDREVRERVGGALGGRSG